ncbi:Phosphatidylinositol 4-kinase LSB6 [Thecaphora frezii]
MSPSARHAVSDRGYDERTPLLLAASDDAQHSAEALTRAGDDDELDFDARFRKWKAAVAHKFKRLERSRDSRPRLLVTVFDGVDGSKQRLNELSEARQQHRIRSSGKDDATLMSDEEFNQQVKRVKAAIEHGIYPKMITTGSSGSYFVRVPADATLLDAQPSHVPLTGVETTTVAVFKPKDEEPYGNLNPKRQFVRKYLWWAMGRPCLIPNFSYLSEVGASYLDSRLVLRMVPRTELVELSSPSFHYAYADRKAYEESGKLLPEKIGSYQTFLNGYTMASDFLRRHPWPSRSRSLALMMRDFEDERHAHKVSRKREKARLRKCGIALKRALLCRTGFDEHEAFGHGDDAAEDQQRQPTTEQPRGTGSMHVNGGCTSLDDFVWTPKRMQNFRLELEKLVVLDFLMRNTDRGLDNFMVHHDATTDEIKIGAIDNSLSFPIKHPNEIRQYPFGWLWLPSDLIGLPFSDTTRSHFLPILNDPIWWQDTVQGLRAIFAKDPHFDEAKLEKQIGVMKGQAWNLIRSLESADEGPLDLCARDKKFVVKEITDTSEEKLADLDGVKLLLALDGRIRTDVLSSEAAGDGFKGLTSSAIFEVPTTPTKPRLSRSGSSTNARFKLSARSSSSRPIGMRASPSYRQALIYAAAGAAWDGDATIDASGPGQPPEGAHPRSLPEHNLTDPFADRPMEESIAVLATVDGARPRMQQQRSGHHHRIQSLQEPGTTSTLLHGSDTADGRDAASRQNYDTVVGRSGIEILETLDRERRKESKMKLFGSGRRRTSIGAAAAQPSAPGTAREDTQTRPARARSPSHEGDEQREGGAYGGEEAGYHDMTGSIVSDPGINRHGLHQRSSSSSVSRRMASSGYIRREGSSQWDDGVLSEEDEDGEGHEDAAEAGSSRGRETSVSPRAKGSPSSPQSKVQGASKGGFLLGLRKRTRLEVGPSIDGILSRANQPWQPATASSSSSGKCHVPHIPHANALAKASRAAGEDHNGQPPIEKDASGVDVASAEGHGHEAAAPDTSREDTAEAEHSASAVPRRSGKTQKRKVRVVVEKLVTDSRQAWLTWF